MEREANAATDNPLIFPDNNGGYEVLSGGNFHGQPIAYAADIIAMAVAEQHFSKARMNAIRR